MVKDTSKRGTICCEEIICVRREPDLKSGPIACLENGTEVEIDMANSNSLFYDVCTAYGIEGYVLTEYVKLQQ